MTDESDRSSSGSPDLLDPVFFELSSAWRHIRPIFHNWLTRPQYVTAGDVIGMFEGCQRDLKAFNARLKGGLEAHPDAIRVRRCLIPLFELVPPDHASYGKLARLVPAGCSDEIPPRDYYPVAESILRAILPRQTPRSSHIGKTGSSKRKEKLPAAARQTPPASVASSSKPTGSKRKARERQDSAETSRQDALPEEPKRRRLAPPIALPPSTIHVKHRAEVVVPRRPVPTPRSQPEPLHFTPTPLSDTDFVPPKIKTPPPSQIATRRSAKKQTETKAHSSTPDTKAEAKPSVASSRGSGATGRGRGRGGKILGSSRLIPSGGIRTSGSTPIAPTPLDGQELLDAISEHPEQVLMPRPCGNCIQRGKAAELRILQVGPLFLHPGDHQSYARE
ncbi:hypothetical protein NLJ89_g12017 [Agrocybe chaxingu]|uniref:Uncharacterized protein n=1 Tax=Agrocybe chaxingu TaxID=84603 RepID=A0A9W8JMP2_9AGAR|nr:hypothetical protein NLJ89_g12017 [Agrocybe chaxingu]